MANNTNWHAWGSDVYHRPDPETDCPVVEIGTDPFKDRLEKLEQEVEWLNKREELFTRRIGDLVNRVSALERK